ncbi:hypothetical protein BT96DRAFT_945959 [Gymnopus androsaceus JB14]|uniref:Uncharacterized protein n=1 Tax=Gymnopus androsaceus JB14 TaxID=1447944 RepID=A0A6A4GZU0_9AGAR|nr:hypothetical protein BT96DRAFT_945959 [Gymnopus androsaceus JB14]
MYAPPAFGWHAENTPLVCPSFISAHIENFSTFDASSENSMGPFFLSIIATQIFVRFENSTFLNFTFRFLKLIGYLWLCFCAKVAHILDVSIFKIFLGKFFALFEMWSAIRLEANEQRSGVLYTVISRNAERGGILNCPASIITKIRDSQACNVSVPELQTKPCLGYMALSNCGIN